MMYMDFECCWMCVKRLIMDMHMEVEIFWQVCGLLVVYNFPIKNLFEIFVELMAVHWIKTTGWASGVHPFNMEGKLVAPFHITLLDIPRFLSCPFKCKCTLCLFYISYAHVLDMDNTITSAICLHAFYILVTGCM